MTEITNPAIKVIAEAMLEKKGKGVLALDLRPVSSSIADWFIVCNADSTTNVAAIADNVLTKMEEKCGSKVYRMQGLENEFWIVLDYGDILVHIFLTPYREFYRLEDLWADAPRAEFADEVPQIAQQSASAKRTKAGSKVIAAGKRISKRSKTVEENGAE